MNIELNDDALSLTKAFKVQNQLIKINSSILNNYIFCSNSDQISKQFSTSAVSTALSTAVGTSSKATAGTTR